jgi:ribonuclease HII
MLIAGIDEAGVSAIAGPVVAGIVVFDATNDIPKSLEGIKDSKWTKRVLGSKGIGTWFRKIINSCLDWAVASVGSEDIDLLNIHNSSLIAMAKAFRNLRIRPDLLWVDGPYAIPEKEMKGIVNQIPQTKADETVWPCSAASIVAKYMRDALMEDMHMMYPQYGFDKNCGYRCECHFAAIRDHGLSKIHRKRFKDCKREGSIYTDKLSMGIDPCMAISKEIKWFGGQR